MREKKDHKNLFKLNWKDYYEELIHVDKYKSIDQRILLLSETRKWFEKYGQFNKLDYDKRSAVAGFFFRQIDGVMPVPDWTWFGSMRGAGHFKSTVKQNNEYLSLALDSIPLNGPVTKNDFNNFKDNFFKSFSYTNPIAVATRLLCIKRPDYFICINNGNRNILCDVFNTRRNIDLEGYWNNIILKILDMPWWNSEPPLNRNELAVYKSRTAFLDVFYYVSLSSSEIFVDDPAASVEDQYVYSNNKSIYDKDIRSDDVKNDVIIQKLPLPKISVPQYDSHKQVEPPPLYPTRKTERSDNQHKMNRTIINVVPPQYDSHEQMEPPAISSVKKTELFDNIDKTIMSIISEPEASKNNEPTILSVHDKTGILNNRESSDNSPEIKRCSECNNKLYSIIKYCPYCGYAFIQSVVPCEKSKKDFTEKNAYDQHDETSDNKSESEKSDHSSLDNPPRKKNSKMSWLTKWFNAISVIILTGVAASMLY